MPPLRISRRRKAPVSSEAFRVSTPSPSHVSSSTYDMHVYTYVRMACIIILSVSRAQRSAAPALPTPAHSTKQALPTPEYHSHVGVAKSATVREPSGFVCTCQAQSVSLFSKWLDAFNTTCSSPRATSISAGTGHVLPRRRRHEMQMRWCRGRLVSTRHVAVSLCVRCPF
jgi:hypothetical protein